MISALLLAGSAALGAQGSDFERSLEATSEGRYSEALRLAESNDIDRASRAQARFWTLYSAGLLDLALAEAEAGLSAAPGDEWLLSQSVEVALRVHDGRRAARYLASLEASGGSSLEPLRERVEARSEAEELAAAGLWRAMLVAACGLSLCAGLFVFWLRGPR